MLSQTKRAKALRKMRREETPAEKEKRRAHRRKLMAAWRKRYEALHKIERKKEK